MIKFIYALLTYTRVIDEKEYTQAQVIAEYKESPTNDVLFKDIGVFCSLNKIYGAIQIGVYQWEQK